MPYDDEREEHIVKPSFKLEGDDVVLFFGNQSFVLAENAAQTVGQLLIKASGELKALKEQREIESRRLEKVRAKKKAEKDYPAENFDPFQECYPDPFSPIDSLIKRLLGEKQ